MVIEDDYSLSNFKLSYAEISHGLSLNVRDEEGIIHIFFSRSSTELDYLKLYTRIIMLYLNSLLKIW